MAGLYLEERTIAHVNWDPRKGKGKRQKGKAVIHRRKLMFNELISNTGKHKDLVGKPHEICGIAKEGTG